MKLMKRIPFHGEPHDDDVCRYEFPGTGRLILKTIHGDVVIDVRDNDVNSFVFTANARIDKVLLTKLEGYE